MKTNPLRASLHNRLRYCDLKFAYSKSGLHQANNLLENYFKRKSTNSFFKDWRAV